jgi:PAS domain-containing protein
LREANATKERGVPVYEIFAFLLGLVFSGKNLYATTTLTTDKPPFGKDVALRFLNKATINWHMFLFSLSIAVTTDVKTLTSEGRRYVLRIDDTTYYRDRSKHVELLSRFYDHSENRYYKCFCLLNMGWSDGQTFLPLDYRVLANADEGKLICGSRAKEDNRTIATRIRRDARTDKPSLVLDMLESVKGTAAETRHVLFDSWFASPSSILSVNGLGYHVVARLKDHRTYRYRCQGEILSAAEIYARNKKRRGRSRHLLSVVVEVRHKDFEDSIPARIVYVRDRSKPGEWIAILSTDMELSEDEIITIYGKRWDIEPFHKVIKSVLKLEKEFQIRSFDAIVAHTAVVLSRYLFLALENRENRDLRSINEGFHALCKELDDITFTYAFKLILEALKQCLCDYLQMANDMVNAVVECFLTFLPGSIKDRLKFSMCES